MRPRLLSTLSSCGQDRLRRLHRVRATPLHIAAVADVREVVAVPAVAAAMFAEEKPALGPLPLEPFRYYQYGQRIHVQWNAAHVRLIDPHTG